MGYIDSICRLSYYFFRSLEKNEYNHITATYFLLAERKLRCKRQEQLNKTKRPEELNVIPDGQCIKTDSTASVKPNLLNVPRTPGDLPQVSYHNIVHQNYTGCLGHRVPN